MERGDVHGLLEALHEAGVDAKPGINAFFWPPVAVDFVDQGWRVLLDADAVNGENNEGFERVLRERGLRWRLIHKTHGTYTEIYNP